MLDDLHTRMVTAIEDDGATLDRFPVVATAGYFQVSGAVSKSSGTVNFHRSLPEARAFPRCREGPGASQSRSPVPT
jgi:hypothetical protein